MNYNKSPPQNKVWAAHFMSNADFVQIHRVLQFRKLSLDPGSDISEGGASGIDFAVDSSSLEATDCEGNVDSGFLAGDAPGSFSFEFNET